MTDREFLLRTYGQQYGPEAGPWNLGVVNKYLEYRITAFFEEQFRVHPGDRLCNIGIGAGAWDRYLSYRLPEGSLISIDRDPLCCRQLREGLIFEENPNSVTVMCGDAMEMDLTDTFSLVTVVGSTIQESGEGLSLLEKAMSLVRKGGSLYFQSLEDVREEALMQAGSRKQMRLVCCDREEEYGMTCCYCKFIKD